MQRTFVWAPPKGQRRLGGAHVGETGQASALYETIAQPPGVA
ncbi:hypothetical protein ACFT4A_31460 [Streptomyces sp. NPDC057099]